MKEKLFLKKDQLYREANEFWMWGLYINLGVFILFLISISINWSPLGWVLGLLSLLSPIALFICNEIYNAKFKAADRCRRLLHYADGLNVRIPETEIACILGDKTKKNITPSTYTEPFYFTGAEPSVTRLLRNTRESAYFTFNLCGLSKLYALGVIFLMFILMIIIFYVVITSSGTQTHIQNLGKSAAAIVSFLFTGNIIRICIKYWQTESSTKELYQQIDSMLKLNNITIEEAMIAVDSYNVAVVKGLPILGKIYAHYEKDLNNSYRSAHGNEEEEN